MFALPDGRNGAAIFGMTKAALELLWEEARSSVSGAGHFRAFQTANNCPYWLFVLHLGQSLQTYQLDERTREDPVVREASIG